MISRKPSCPPDGIRISGSAYARLEEAVREAYPGEACGVLLGETESGVVSVIRSMENRAGAEIAGRYYRIDPPALYRLELRAEENGYGIIGFWHSHVEAEAVLSREDERYMIPGMVYLILPVTGGRPGQGRAYIKATADSTAREIRIRVKEQEKNESLHLSDTAELFRKEPGH